MDLRELRYFRVIAEFGSLSKAAVHLRVAQPALSRHVSKLEAELGVELLLRTTRGVTLTDAGRALLEHIARLDQEIEVARRRVSAFSDQVTGALRIGVQPPLSVLLMPPVVKSYRASHPEVMLNVTEGSSSELTDALLNRRIDVAVYDVPRHAQADLKSFPLWHEPLGLVGPPRASRSAAFRAGKVTATELQALPIIMPSRRSSIRRLVDEAFAAQGLKFRPVLEAGSAPLICELVKTGLGFTLMPGSVVNPWVATGELVAIAIEPTIRWTISMATRNELMKARTVAPFVTLMSAVVPHLIATKRLGSATLCLDQV